MKIFHVIEATAAGTLSMVSLLANAQCRLGNDVVVIYSNRPETPTDLSGYFIEGIVLINIPMSRLKDMVSSLFKLRRFFLNGEPDVVFMHSSFAGFLGRVASLFTLNQTRFLYLPHCISFMRKDINSFKRLSFIAFEWLAALKNADYVACSRSEQKEILSKIPFRLCHLVDNALDFSNIPVSKTDRLLPKSRIVVTVGRIRPQKGPEIFADIARIVSRIDPSIKFIWVGDGDSDSRSNLERAGVEVAGWVNSSGVWERLQKAQLYLSTALWEGMPVSLIESFCIGLPVVASNCAGNIDVVEHGVTGWLYSCPEEAAQFIIEALNNYQMSNAVARNAYESACSRFSIERYLSEIDEVVKMTQ